MNTNLCTQFLDSTHRCGDFYGNHIISDHVDGMWRRCALCIAPGHYVSAHPNQTCCFWCKKKDHSTNDHRCSVCNGSQHRGRDHFKQIAVFENKK